MIRRAKRREGYTIIEVMMAVGIMTVGAVGIMALQQAATRGNSYARQMSTATEVTRSWIERLRRDALLWNQPGLAGTTRTVYLQNVPASGTEIGEWFTPDTTAAPAGESAGADYQGMDVALDADPGPVYCTQVRLRWVIDQQAIRADVRTYWHRSTTSANTEISDRRLFAACAATGEQIDAELARPSPRLHAVYGSMLLRWTPLEGT